MNLKPTYRKISHQKLLLLLIIALKYQIDKPSDKYKSYFQTDIARCPTCFQAQKQTCKQIFTELETVEEEYSLLQLLSYITATFGKRDITLLKLKNQNTKLVAKYLAKGQNNLYTPTISQAELTRRFFDKARLDGLQFCPAESLQRFIELFKPNYSDYTIWLYLVVNVQPLLLPFLETTKLGEFPIPETYATCGFTLFQRYAGKSLMHFIGSSDFRLKLKIAKQLLEAAVKFTEGFNGFRIYITDLNLDNIAYDPTLNRLTFVDLDTVLIVDTLNMTTPMHKHQYIECMDCFAYSPADICESQKSDINIFSSCQLLREDLKQDITKGFLYSITETYANLTLLLNMCLDCPSPICQNRFDAAIDLIKYIEHILFEG